MIRHPETQVTGSLLFADVDGVLNGHERGVNGYCGTKPKLVDRFNEVIARTNCRIVVSSAWRYLVHNNFMSITGLENLFLTHGVDCRNRIVGILRKDWTPTVTDRGRQIKEWMDEFGAKVKSYVVVDDRTFEIPEHGHPFVKTNGARGLSAADVEAVVRLLGRSRKKTSRKVSRQWDKKSRGGRPSKKPRT